jgi:two-component system invasion response regulator UvrY
VGAEKQKEQPMLRILNADDHSIVRRGLIQILLQAFPSAYIGQTSDADELLAKVFEEEWDVVITDISMPGRSGLEVLQEIRRCFPTLPVLVLSMYPEDQYAIRAMSTGAALMRCLAGGPPHFRACVISSASKSGIYN